MKVLYFAWIRERVGKAEEMIDPPASVRTVADLVAWLNLVGVDPSADPGLAALANSPCLKLILGEIGRLDCDQQARTLLESIARDVGATAERPSGAQ